MVHGSSPSGIWTSSVKSGPKYREYLGKILYEYFSSKKEFTA